MLNLFSNGSKWISEARAFTAFVIVALISLIIGPLFLSSKRSSEGEIAFAISTRSKSSIFEKSKSSDWSVYNSVSKFSNSSSEWFFFSTLSYSKFSIEDRTAGFSAPQVWITDLFASLISVILLVLQ